MKNKTTGRLIIYYKQKYINYFVKYDGCYDGFGQAIKNSIIKLYKQDKNMTELKNVIENIKYYNWDNIQQINFDNYDDFDNTFDYGDDDIIDLLINKIKKSKYFIRTNYYYPQLDFISIKTHFIDNEYLDSDDDLEEIENKYFLIKNLDLIDYTYLVNLDSYVLEVNEKITELKKLNNYYFNN